MTPDATIRKLVLVGLMGTGKTTTGRVLAARLGWSLRDSDAEIEAATGETVAVLRGRIGTAGIHDLEAAALLRALGGEATAVVCAAASVVDREDCLQALRAPAVAIVWLTAQPAVAGQRFRTSDHRPWYGADPEAVLAGQGREREVAFRSLDPVEVATDELPPDAVVSVALAALAGRGRLPA
ncbi:MAG: shikimate kinase [Candidatus Limnocylindrales bacterium]